MRSRTLHVGAERGVNCEHMQALVTNIFQRHWEWQEDRRTDLQPRPLCKQVHLSHATFEDVQLFTVVPSLSAHCT